MIGDNTVVVPISRRKFQPMTPKIKKAPMFGNCVPTPLSKNERKKMRQPMQKVPVLTTGTDMLAKISPKRRFFFLKSLNIKPAATPANVHFNKHTTTVPTGLMGINNAIVDGDNKAIIPLKKPNIAPDTGPHKTPAKTTATNERLILAGPICTKLPIVCKTIISANNSPVMTILRVIDLCCIFPPIGHNGPMSTKELYLNVFH